MTREPIAAKAARLLTEGRVTVTSVHGDIAVARVVGDTGTYLASHGPEGWRCTCPARGRCSHVLALKLVTIRPAEGQAGTTATAEVKPR